MTDSSANSERALILAPPAISGLTLSLLDQAGVSALATANLDELTGALGQGAGLAIIVLVGIALIHANLGWFVGEHGTGGMEFSWLLGFALLVLAANDHERGHVRAASAAPGQIDHAGAMLAPVSRD